MLSSAKMAHIRKRTHTHHIQTLHTHTHVQTTALFFCFNKNMFTWHNNISTLSCFVLKNVFELTWICRRWWWIGDGCGCPAATIRHLRTRRPGWDVAESRDGCATWKCCPAIRKSWPGLPLRPSRAIASRGESAGRPLKKRPEAHPAIGKAAIPSCPSCRRLGYLLGRYQSIIN